MGVATKRSSKVRSPAAWRGIPPIMRVLYITDPQRTGGWLAEAFATESPSEIRLQEVVGSAAGLARLRDEVFDIVLVSHDALQLDALELIGAYRASGAEGPIVALGTQSEQEMVVPCYEAGADGYVCVNTSTTRNLIWLVTRAVQRHELIRDNHRLNLAEQQRLQREHEEAQRLLVEQRALTGTAEANRPCQDASLLAGFLEADVHLHLPQPLIDHYRELLRTYVIMGSGNLCCELRRLAELLAAAGVTSQETMQLHLFVLEELVRGLGSRSTRHVMTRADLLAMDILIHLAEQYRRRYQQRAHAPVQLLLPGFDEELPHVL